MEDSNYQGHNDFDFPKNSERKTNDDWKGCQGHCDFDPIPNTTGWI